MDVQRATLQFRVGLVDVSPPVWRRIEVPAGYSFWDLHVAIQDAMGWLDSHLHLFRVRNPASGRTDEIGIPDPDLPSGEQACLAGWEVPVAGHFGAVGATATYEYDFGDGWVHEIELEAIGSRQRGARYPRCLAGERACPPEDCGGPHGYAELLRAIADPAHEDHEEMLEWLGGRFDPEAFSPERVKFANPARRWRLAFADEEPD